jgi:cold shock CspA family protein
MYTGTISALDPDQGFGLIDADDGAIVLLHPDSPRPEFERRALRVGQRVIFSVEREMGTFLISPMSAASLARSGRKRRNGDIPHFANVRGILGEIGPK